MLDQFILDPQKIHVHSVCVFLWSSLITSLHPQIYLGSRMMRMAIQMKTQQRVITGKLEQWDEHSFGYLSLGKLAILPITRLSYSLTQIKSGSHISLFITIIVAFNMLPLSIIISTRSPGPTFRFWPALHRPLCLGHSVAVTHTKLNHSKHYPC